MDTRRFLLYLYDLLFGANKHSSGCLLLHNERVPIFTTYQIYLPHLWIFLPLPLA